MAEPHLQCSEPVSVPGGQWLGAIWAFPHAFYFVKKTGGPVVLWAAHVTRCVGVGAQHHLGATLLWPPPPEAAQCSLTP